jgi:phosphatidylinositol alpha-1,6-mannosyltransferase
MTVAEQGQIEDNGELHAAGRVLLLAPSNGLGGGIERFTGTVQESFAELGVACQRLDLERPGMRSHLTMLTRARRLLRSSSQRTTLVVSHVALVPVARMLAHEPVVVGVSVLCHGSDMWSTRLRLRRSIGLGLMRHPGIQAVAASGFTAGTLAASCRAAVLPPGLSRGWFETLAAAGDTAPPEKPDIHIVTAFRLASWRDKGAAELVAAIAALDRRDVRLTICGSGDPPPGLREIVEAHPWCGLSVGRTDRELAQQLAAADLFVLATRTRVGRRPSGEGFGLVLLEAQVAGTPVIAPAYGGSSDAYVEGVTGFAPEDETREALTKLLREVVSDRAALAAMGEQAATWARGAFAPERYTQLVARRLL